MHKSIIMLSLLISFPVFAAGDVERAALTPQRAIPSVGSSVSNSSRTVVGRGSEASSDTSVGGGYDRRATGGTERRSVSRETAVARTTATSSGVVQQRGGDSDGQRSVALRASNSTGGVGARVGVSPTTVTSSARTVARGSSIGSVSVSQNTRLVDASSVTAVKTNMESLTELKDSCKRSYYSCMDNFCNNLDENMGRCACNKSIKNYAKTEEALAAATQELQDVAQKIQYIGLTPTEITTLFTETEAETALGQKVDNSKIKNDLDRIKNMIVGVKSGSSSAAITENSGISLDLSNLLSFNIDSAGFDITGLFGNQTQNTQSILNQRGEALYKSAAARCKSAVLNDCSTYGIDAAVIVNSYDIEIDKDCMLYERKLTDENTAMLSTIRNAKTVLQKARLMVAQQKNEYDLRGCISALDSCMQDDFVCGTDYEECLDPTGKYIVDGNVVVGSMPGVARGTWGDDGTDASASSGLYTVWNNNGKNIWARSGDYSISEYISNTMSLKNAQENLSDNMSIWLQHRMGYHDNSSKRNYGMCVSILNKCQKYTYDKDGNYLGENTVIQSWLASAFRKIKQGQDRVLMNYAQTCLGDVTSCLNQNNFGMYSNVSNSSGTNPSDMAIKACLSVINTCRSVTMGLSDADVSTDNLSDIYVWLDAGIGTAYQSYCESTGGKWTPNTEATYDGSCSCAGDLVPATTTNNKYCVCATAGYVWSETDQACIDPNASSSSGGSGSGSGSSGSQSGGGNTQTNTTVTITLNANGGAGTIKTSSGTANVTSGSPTTAFTCTAGSSITLPVWASGASSNNTTNITKSSRKFIGWSTSSSAQSAATVTTCPSADTRYYAVWKQCTCTGGCSVSVSNNVCGATCTNTAYTKTCTEYNCVCSASSSGTQTTITLNKIHGSNATKYLYTTQNTGVYTDANRSQSISANTSLLDLIGSTTWNGYDFDGYYESGSNTTRYISRVGALTQEGYDAALGYAQNKTWVAKWTPNIYTVTLDDMYYSSSSASGVAATTSVSPNVIFLKYGDGWYSNYTATTSISAVSVPTKDGYQFGGFYTGKTGTGTQAIAANGNIIGSNTLFSSGTSKTLYAKWTNPCGEHGVYQNGTCGCESGYGRVVDSCVPQSEYSTIYMSCLDSGGGWNAEAHNCRCMSEYHLQQHSSQQYCVCEPGYVKIGNNQYCTLNPCGANQHQVQQGGTNVCVCDTGYEMVYDDNDVGIYCVQPTMVTNISSNVTEGNDGHASCAVQTFQGVSTQPGNGRCVASNEAFPPGTNYFVTFDAADSDRVYGYAECVNNSVKGLHTSYDNGGDNCSCQVTFINGSDTTDNFYKVLVGDETDIGGSCTNYCPATCAYLMTTDSSFRVKSLTARQQ